MKYKIEVGSFVTRMITRNLVIHAKNEDEVKEKAIDKYREIENNLKNGGGVYGHVNIDSIELAE